MLARWIATVAALLLACAQASAHVRVERESGLDLERTAALASPGELTQQSKTARPARASPSDLASGENAALTHCHVRPKSALEENRASDRGVYAYTAFGEADPAGTSGDSSGSTENNYRYTGEQLDPNLGFYYLRARYMDPSQGRFLGMDPWGGLPTIPGTLHKYAYANQNAANWIDPGGQAALRKV